MKKTTLFCLVLAVFLSGCSSSNANTSKNVQNTKSVQQSSNNQFIMAGKIEANQEANLTSKISAKVAEISVDVGSKVNQGDVIIKLDTQDLQAQVDKAQASVNTARANLANASNGSRPEQIEQQQGVLDSASQSYATAKKSYDRVQALVNSGAEAQQQLDLAKQQLASAEGQYKSAQAQLDMLKNGPTSSSIDVYKAQVNEAEAGLKIAQTSLSNATITAPISGVVNAKNINIGEIASPGATLVSISNSGALCVNAYAPLEIVNGLKEGQDVMIKVSEVPDKEFQGKITVINSKLNSQSTNILVKVSVIDPNLLLKPGMFAEVGLKK
ncbi:HlyD family efflux transporter periplasmic adaptor subunit [Clostridium sp. P21]|uniref:HlyD family efflux transporter periplasmic adaptor subunit n=1 Tax=Clostridium muellerianum TaxID=2716538 RepID=A0A7Y0HQI3_9CLOT|nr:efflux RND transporter periplasmic adaptor subunit [Clostridium muellerianum]NMM65160.1 HlyD family efflux transporter periplasmic adaptor subunit [Clostridium muellerianum]